jgi:hypothetical protein
LSEFIVFILSLLLLRSCCPVALERSVKEHKEGAWDTERENARDGAVTTGGGTTTTSSSPALGRKRARKLSPTGGGRGPELEAHHVTIHRDIIALGLTSLVQPKVVNDDAVKNAQRLDFAKGLYRLKCENILFTDECWFTTNDNTIRVCF